MRRRTAPATVLPPAFASDTLSVTVTEFVDNAIILIVPGAMEAGLRSVVFWVAPAFAPAVASGATFPVNHRPIARGRGHAAAHRYHGGRDAGRKSWRPHPRTLEYRPGISLRSPALFTLSIQAYSFAYAALRWDVSSACAATRSTVSISVRTVL